MKKTLAEILFYQKTRRRTIKESLQLFLGNYCHRCSETFEPLPPNEAKDLRLMIRNQKSYKLPAMVMYKHILHKLIPKKEAILLCPDCYYGKKWEKNQYADVFERERP